MESVLLTAVLLLDRSWVVAWCLQGVSDWSLSGCQLFVAQHVPFQFYTCYLPRGESDVVMVGFEGVFLLSGNVTRFFCC